MAKIVQGAVISIPQEKSESEVDVFYWIRKERLAEGLENRLGEALKKWLQDVWPFEKVGFPGRD